MDRSPILKIVLLHGDFSDTHGCIPVLATLRGRPFARTLRLAFFRVGSGTARYGKIGNEKEMFFFSFCCLVYTICLLYGFHIYGFCFGDKSDGCEVILENIISKLLLSHLNATSLAYQQVAPLLEQRRRPDDPPTLFLYLTQTEQCLPDQLKLTIGNSSICQCHVVVLSYQKKCDEDSQVMYSRRQKKVSPFDPYNERAR